MRVLHMSIREAVFGWSREAGIRGKMSMRSQALSQKAKNCICRILIMVSQSRAGICRRKRHRLLRSGFFLFRRALRILPFPTGFFRILRGLRWRQTVRNFQQMGRCFSRRMEKSCCTVLPQAIRRGWLCQIQSGK